MNPQSFAGGQTRRGVAVDRYRAVVADVFALGGAEEQRVDHAEIGIWRQLDAGLANGVGGAVDVGAENAVADVHRLVHGLRDAGPQHGRRNLAQQVRMNETLLDRLDQCRAPDGRPPANEATR